MRIRVALVDDHTVVRAGIRLLINAEKDMEVVGEAADGAEAVKLVSDTKPNVLILDLAMPKQNGLQAISTIKQTFPEVHILVLTMHDDAAYLRSVLATEGTGYVLKTAEDQELLTAIRVVASGKVYVNAKLRNTVIQTRYPRKTATPGSEAVTQLLSEREQVVLKLVAAGHTNQEIGDRLTISVKSVETYRARLMDKLALRTRADLVRFALNCGLLSFGEAAQPLNVQ